MYDPSGLYIDPILSNFSIGWQDQTLYGYRIFPETPTNTKSGKYRVYDRSNWIIFPSVRAPGTVANEVRGGKWSEDTFSTVQHALQVAIHDEERRELHSQGGLANDVFGGDLSLDPDIDGVNLVTRSIMLEHELKVATAMRNSANYAGNHVITLSGSSKFSDYTYVTAGIPESVVSDPVSVLKTAIQRIYLDSGKYPNTMTLPFDAVGVIDNHPRVVARFKNFSLTSPGAWEALTGLPTPGNIFVTDSRYNSADNIEATESLTGFWGQDIWLGVVDPTPGQKTQTFGKTFAYKQPDGSTRPTESWREEGRKSDLKRVTYEYDIKITGANCGYLIKNAVAAVT